MTSQKSGQIGSALAPQFHVEAQNFSEENSLKVAKLSGLRPNPGCAANPKLQIDVYIFIVRLMVDWQSSFKDLEIALKFCKQ